MELRSWVIENVDNFSNKIKTEEDVKMHIVRPFLESLGYVYKSYQEKERITYVLDGYELDIDTWPGIPTYVEIEGKDEADLENILNKIGYTMKDTVSCTADEIYEMNGLSMFDKREIKFEDYE